jgi:hypothetical protein
MSSIGNTQAEYRDYRSRLDDAIKKMLIEKVTKDHGDETSEFTKESNFTLEMARYGRRGHPSVATPPIQRILFGGPIPTIACSGWIPSDGCFSLHSLSRAAAGLELTLHRPDI